MALNDRMISDYHIDKPLDGNQLKGSDDGL
jgi:hypothetical protein